jgi:hypothetical protein
MYRSFDSISSLLHWLFLVVISLFSEKIKELLFVVEYFLGIFGSGMIVFKLLVVVISSGGLSEGSMLLRALNEASAGIATGVLISL